MNKPKVHLICNAHLDPVWQWPWTEGCAEALATFQTAVQLLKEYPELIFNHNEAILYEWAHQYNPLLFKRIQDLVQAGKWCISGGWYLQPDVNLPPTRNLIKHIREGKKFFETYFDTQPKVAYNFDSFGHSSGLPGLLNKEGYQFYIHMRPDKNDLDLPDNLYQWKGSDGSMIPTYRIEVGLYHTERNNIRQRIEEAQEMVAQLNRDVAVFWGLGNHGGGATRADLEIIRNLIEHNRSVPIIHSTTEQFYEALKPWIVQAPVYAGEVQRIFTGTYSSMARLKRKAIELSEAAHQMDALMEYSAAQNKDTTEVWRDILFNDFHDILTGTCTRKAEEDAFDLYGHALENIRVHNQENITRLNLIAPKLEAHIPLSLYHHYQGLRQFPVEFECMSDYRPFWDEEKILQLSDRSGQLLVSQEEAPAALLPFHRWRRKVVFMAPDLSPGLHHFALHPIDPLPDDFSRPVYEPDPYKLTFRVYTDEADSWGTNTWSWDDEIACFAELPETQKIIADGPIRTVYESEFNYNHSRLILSRRAYKHWPITEYRIRIHWAESYKRLKVVLPLDKDMDHLKCEIPGGRIIRNADGQEHCHGTWMEIDQQSAGQTQKSGISVAHNGLHAYDFHPGRLSLTILRSVAYCHWHEYDLSKGQDPEIMDQGVHEIKLAIWESASLPNTAEEIATWLNAPALVLPHLPISQFAD